VTEQTVLTSTTSTLISHVCTVTLICERDVAVTFPEIVIFRSISKNKKNGLKDQNCVTLNE